MRISVLGPVEVEIGGSGVDLGGPRQRLVLALIAAGRGAPVSTDRLVEHVWSDEERPSKPRKNIQVHVATLRRQLGGDPPLVGTSGGYRIDTARCELDLIEFEHEVARAEAELDTDPETAADRLRSALGRWRGQAFADLADVEALRSEATRLDNLRLQAVELRIDAEIRLGRHRSVLSELDTLTAQHPFRERLRELHMTALYRSGRQVEALRAFSHTRRVLAEELGIEPSAELRALESAILRQDPSLAVTDAERDLGGSPSSIRGFELREVVGDGDASTVWRAYQSALGREVALRVVRPELARRPDVVRRFEEDLHRLAAIEHPHLAAILDAWRDPDGAYVVMPWYRGGTLGASLARARWRPDAALRLVEQVGGGLAALHRHGAVHGRIEPDAVLFDDEGNAVLSGAAASTARPSDESSVERDLDAFVELACDVIDDDLTPPDERPQRAEDVVRWFRRSLGADVIGTDRDASPPRDPIRNPYKGLRAFGESDADDFHGRDDLVRAVVTSVRRNTVTTVVGPSGSGKSSAVRAGVVPVVRAGELEGDWLVAEMFPGSYPFEELESALLRIAVHRPDDLMTEMLADDRGMLRVVKRMLPDDGTGLLLVIDQFEELWSLTTDATARQAFLDALIAIAGDRGGRLRVVLTIRADFFDRPLDHPELGRIVRDGLVAVPTPDEDALAMMIGEPARSAGLELEPGLVPRIVRDVINQPSALPLLQYALTEVVRRSDGVELTIGGYEASGGVLGALARRADDIFDALTSHEQDVCRSIFVRLVAVDESGGDSRRRVRRSELDRLGLDPAAVDAVLASYGGARLVAFDRDPVTRGPTVEVAHEALLREWPRLSAWIEEEREGLLRESRLRAAAAEWTASGRDDAFLLRGRRLAQFEASDRPPGDDESALLDASRAAADVAERRRRRRRRIVLATAVVVATIASALTAIAVRARRDADRTADALAQTALQSRAISEAPGRTDLALLLAAEAYEREPGVESERSLLAALREVRATSEIVSDGEFATASVRACARSPRHGLFVAQPNGFRSGGVPDPGGEIVEIDVDSGAVRRIESEIACDITSASPDGALIAGLDVEGCAVVVAARSGEVRHRDCGSSKPTFLPDGRVALREGPLEPSPAAWTILDLETNATVRLDEPIAFVSSSPGRSSSIVVELLPEDGPPRVEIWDPRTLEAIRPLATDVELLAESTWSGDGGTVALLDLDGNLWAWARDDWERGTDDPTGVVDPFVFESVDGQPVAVTPDDSGERFAVLMADDSVRVLDRDGGQIAEVEPSVASVMEVTWTDDGLLAALSNTGVVEVLDPAGAGLFEVSPARCCADGEFVPEASLVPNGPAPYYVVGTRNGAFKQIDLGTGEFELVDIARYLDEEFSDPVPLIHTESGHTTLVRAPFEMVTIDGDGAETARATPFEMSPTQPVPAIPILGTRADVRPIVVEGPRADTLRIVLMDLPTLDVVDEHVLELSFEPAGWGFPQSVPELLLVGESLDDERDVAHYYDLAGNEVISFEIPAGFGWIEVDADLQWALIARRDDDALLRRDLTTGEEIALPIRTAGYRALFVGDDRFVLQDADGDLALWDAIAGTKIASLADPGPDPARPLMEDGGDAVWFVLDGVPSRFPLDPAVWRDRACELAGRSLTEDEWDEFVPGDEPARDACSI